ncbi:MAG: flagellar motor protein MotB [Lacisediminihabitans sp.]
MSLRPQRRKKGEEEEPDNSERWMASYMDMVTVLMAMFIVLFAMSVVDQHKFDELRNSLATGFGTTATKTIDVNKGIVVPQDQLNKKATGLDSEKHKLATIEVTNLIALREEMRQNLKAVGLDSSVQFSLDERGLTVRLVGSETYFVTNRTDLSPVAIEVLNAVGPPLTHSPYKVSVEGHADVRQSSAPYATNWELSSGRATVVLRHLVESNGFPAERIGAVGFGSARPLAKGTSPEDLATNRRVDIVVLSDQSDAVRSLIAEVDKALEGT